MLASTKIVVLIFLFLAMSRIDGQDDQPLLVTANVLAIWENATVPFYINNEHFDHEQSKHILTALSMFAFKTCIKFMPVMAPPNAEEVLVFQNPEAVKRCVIKTTGHSVFGPHVLNLGYDCLKSPEIDMMIMKALGFPFEHNRIIRDDHIQVLQENIEPGAIDLFTKEDILPLPLRFLQYDINSVMHFGQRDYSRNGHRTIIFKNPNLKQNRQGLTAIDLKKIEIVYGPLCLARDRQEKIELCQSYPGVGRKKREVESDPPTATKSEINVKDFYNKSLRVNPDITVPPTPQSTTEHFKDLDVNGEVQLIIENTYKISNAALRKAKEKYCNGTVPTNTEIVKTNRPDTVPSTDIMGIVEAVNSYVQSNLDESLQNITQFCEETDLKLYQRSRWCDFSVSDPRCRHSYRSTKSGLPRHSTQHRPAVYTSTKNYGGKKYKQYGRSGNDTVDVQPENKERGPENTVLADIIHSKADVEVTERSEGKDAEQTNDKVEDENDKGIIAVEHGRRLMSHKKSHSQYNENRPKGNKNDDVIRPPKRPSQYDEENRPANVERPIRRPRKKGKGRLGYAEAESEGDIKRPRDIYPKRLEEEESKRIVDVEPKRQKDREKGKRLREPKKTISSELEEAERPMDVIKEWKTDYRSPTKKRKQKKVDYSTDNVNEEDKQNSDLETSEIPKTVELSKANLEFYKERMWPERTVWFMIQEDKAYDTDAMRRRIDEVNRILKKRTCVKLVEIQPSQVNKYEDYLVIDNSPDYVTGRVGGKQNFGSIELFRGDQHRQHTAMMVMAMLGFYFEVSRHDRDQYIRVHMRHVRPDKLHHFELIRSDATLPVPYDYASATHPAWQFWRQLGRTGISTVATFKENDPDGSLMKSLGQNEKLLSEIDIVKINSVYGVKCFKKRHKGRDALRSANETIVRKQTVD